MVQRLAAQGFNLEAEDYRWDDGSDHDDVTKIYVGGGDGRVLQNIYFDYVKSGQPKEGSCHLYLVANFTEMFEINHLRNEYLESVEGYYSNESKGIVALQFKTNFRTSQVIGLGYPTIHSRKFSLAVNGKKIIGFHGCATTVLISSLGAYFTPITPSRLEAKGGKGGKEWNDGYDHDDVSKIYVRGDSKGIQFIKVDYIKNGQVENGLIHGVSRGGFTQTFEIDHLNNEYLVSIEGCYDETSGVIQGLQFKTNIKTFDMMGYEIGRKFSLAANGNKIIGFHGYADKSLNSLGIYFTLTSNSNKLECVGHPSYRGIGFIYWDDGSYNDSIRKVYVASDEDGISCIRVEYDNGGKIQKTHRRLRIEDEKEFVLDYPNEFITSVQGTWADGWIMSLTFKTSKGRSSPTYGNAATGNNNFLLESKGNALVGFYGWSASNCVSALGAYYRPFPPPPDANKIEAKGGDEGDSWDDGGFEGIRTIYIGLNQNDVAFVKFMYYKDAKMRFGDDHGNKTLIDIQEFELDYPNGYLKSVEGSYDTKSGVITMLKFTIENQASIQYGLATATSSSFLLHKDDHKIVGFHGRSSNLLHQIGVHVIPI